MSRICIFGGSFDPIHLAHIRMAERAREQFSLNEVVFMPTGTSYHKGHCSAPPAQRNALIRCAIDGKENFTLSTLDEDREGDIYTADTLAIFKEKHPQDELFFLMGADSFTHILSWYKPEDIFNSCELIVAKRPGIDSSECMNLVSYISEKYADARIHFLEGVYEDISSTHIRELVWNCSKSSDKAAFKELSALIGEKAADYIIKNNLYIDEKPWTEEEILEELKFRLSADRYKHTLGVADTAEALAKRYGVPVKKGRLAGILHDCGKFLKGDEYIKRALMADIPLNDAELANPALIHAKLGAYYAKERYHINDEDILAAIRSHTTGRPCMSLLEEIIYVADYIEPSRDEAENLDFYRKEAFLDLKKTVMMIAGDILRYLHEKGAVIDKTTQATYDWYRARYEK